MTDWDMVVETFPNGRHNFPEVHPQDAEARDRAGSRRRCRSVRASAAVHLRRSHHAVEHRRARPERADLSPPICDHLPRARVVLERHGQDPVVRAVPRRHADAVHDRRRRSCTSATSILISDGAGRLSPATSTRPLAGADLSGRARRSTFPTQKESSFKARIHGVRPGRFRRHVPFLQGRPRAEGHVHQPGGRRERVALPEPARLACSGCPTASSHRRDRAVSTAARARFDYLMAPLGKPGVPTRATWDVDYATSISPG